MRELNAHKVNGLNSELTIKALDEPGVGGASHLYSVAASGVWPTYLWFQDGPIAEVGVNGITQEALLAIIADRLAGFQSGPFANPYNAEALAHIQAAQDALAKRTMERIDRGVEGTLQV